MIQDTKDEVSYIVKPNKGTKKRVPKRGKYVNVRTEPKVHRNESCICGSGKKYKKCCLLNK